MKFFIGDMRNFNHTTTYDYVFNLFTSFGYFAYCRRKSRRTKMHSQATKKNGYY